MERKLIKVLFLFICVIMALVCRHRSEAQETKVSPNDNCLRSILSVKGCFNAVKAAFGGDIKGLTKDCCHVVNGLAEGCFPVVFPGTPFTRLLVKAVCTEAYGKGNY
ncbi:unnamed protein product [Arabis nemorensis]|uniref:Prolamin-like domain-containing protein n=1 Tax=Arabis nemorensis TaxID=586526 RepID=A0A565CLR1_9BRAS|nr:unnamed protein product [Arabis nemorensis]